MLERARFALAQPCAADHFVLGRIVAVDAFDRGAHPLDILPQFHVRGVPFIAEIRQLRFERIHLGLTRTPRCDLIGQGLAFQVTKGRGRVEPISGIQHRLGLIEQIGWIQLLGHEVPPVRVKKVLPGAVPQS